MILALTAGLVTEAQSLQEIRNLLIGLLQNEENVLRHKSVALIQEGNSHARISRASRTANSMHIFIDVVRGIHVDDHGDIGDIQTSRGDISCDKYLDFVASERSERLLAVHLIAIPVNYITFEVAVLEEVVDEVRLLLRLAEHKHSTLFPPLQLIHQQCDLLLVLGVEHTLFDLADGCAYAANGQEEIVLKEVARKTLDLVRERGAEHHSLARPRHAYMSIPAGMPTMLFNHFADLRTEAHIQHAICLVQHQEPMNETPHKERTELPPFR